ncbi:unnamed protein product [Pleuronectes platessa]|uniref:Secreted protein n=1 Tax=Pleuronectes platessa TaxID=8262 RepID=A0A9N7YB22_PLEPL|nr:unnamed protein product [Pleuronectes platessa]
MGAFRLLLRSLHYMLGLSIQLSVATRQAGHGEVENHISGNATLPTSTGVRLADVPTPPSVFEKNPARSRGKGDGVEVMASRSEHLGALEAMTLLLSISLSGSCECAPSSSHAANSSRTLYDTRGSVCIP